MKTPARVLAMVCAFVCAVAADQTPAAKQPRPAAPGVKPASPDAPFLGAAGMDGLAEIEHGRLAIRNASAPEVKRFAQRMVDDHQKAVEQVKGLALKKEVTLATKLDDQHQAKYDELAKLQGTAFDRAYMAHMVKAHLQAVEAFQQELKTGKDPDVKAWASRMLPTLQEHVKLASAIEATVGRVER